MRRIVGVKRADQRVEVGVKEIVKKKQMRSKLRWPGHVETLGGVQLATRADVENVDGKGSEEDRECDGRTALREI